MKSYLDQRDHAARADMESDLMPAMQRVCPECSVGLNEPCLNLLTGKPYSRPLVHLKRLREEAADAAKPAQ